MVLFLFKSYSSLNLSNKILKSESENLEKIQKIKKVIYLDFSLALSNTTNIQIREKNEDFVYLQTSNSIHKRFNPYVVYMVKDKKLYRLESLKKIDSYDLSPDSELNIDYIAKVNGFKVYKSSDKQRESYLVHIDFIEYDNLLYKINTLNEY